MTGAKYMGMALNGGMTQGAVADAKLKGVEETVARGLGESVDAFQSSHPAITREGGARLETAEAVKVGSVGADEIAAKKRLATPTMMS